MGQSALGTDKDVEALAREARRAGWTVGIDGATHIRWQAPNGGEFRSPLTGSRYTALRVRRGLARLDPVRFGTKDAEAEVTPLTIQVRLQDEVGVAVEELRQTADVLELAAELGDPNDAAELVRHARQMLRDCEDALRDVARRHRQH